MLLQGSGLGYSLLQRHKTMVTWSEKCISNDGLSILFLFFCFVFCFVFGEAVNIVFYLYGCLFAEWLLDGLAGFLTDSFVKRFLGINEARYRRYKV